MDLAAAVGLGATVGGGYVVVDMSGKTPDGNKRQKPKTQTTRTPATNPTSVLGTLACIALAGVVGTTGVGGGTYTGCVVGCAGARVGAVVANACFISTALAKRFCG